MFPGLARQGILPPNPFASCPTPAGSGLAVAAHAFVVVAGQRLMLIESKTRKHPARNFRALES